MWRKQFLKREPSEVVKGANDTSILPARVQPERTEMTAYRHFQAAPQRRAKKSNFSAISVNCGVKLIF